MFRRSLALVTAARTLIENKFLDACLADAATPRLSDRLPDGGGKGERHTSLQQPNDGAESPEVTENLRRQCKGEGEVESCLEKNCQRISNSWKSLNTPVALRLQHSSIVPSNMYYDALLSSPPPKKPLQLRSSTNFQDCGIKLSQLKPVGSQELEPRATCRTQVQQLHLQETYSPMPKGHTEYNLPGQMRSLRHFRGIPGACLVEPAEVEQKVLRRGAVGEEAHLNVQALL